MAPAGFGPALDEPLDPLAVTDVDVGADITPGTVVLGVLDVVAVSVGGIAMVVVVVVVGLGMDDVVATASETITVPTIIGWRSQRNVIGRQ